MTAKPAQKVEALMRAQGIWKDAVRAE